MLAFAIAACDSGDKPYLAFAGGGFVARVLRPIPDGSILEAEFEDPGGGAPILMRQNAVSGRNSYHFQTPPVQGVQADRDYHVVLRLLDTHGSEIASYGKTFRSNVSQDVLPAAPTVVGPGHQPAPATQ